MDWRTKLTIRSVGRPPGEPGKERLGFKESKGEFAMVRAKKDGGLASGQSTSVPLKSPDLSSSASSNRACIPINSVPCIPAVTESLGPASFPVIVMRGNFRSPAEVGIVFHSLLTIDSEVLFFVVGGSGLGNLSTKSTDLSCVVKLRSKMIRY